MGFEWHTNPYQQNSLDYAQGHMEGRPRGIEKRLRGEIRGYTHDMSSMPEVTAALGEGSREVNAIKNRYGNAAFMNSPEQQQQAQYADIGDAETGAQINALEAGSRGLQWRYGLKAQMEAQRRGRNRGREEDTQRALLGSSQLEQTQSPWLQYGLPLLAGGISAFGGGVGAAAGKSLFGA